MYSESNGPDHTQTWKEYRFGFINWKRNATGQKRGAMGNVIAKLKYFGLLLKRTFKQWWDREPFNNSIIIAYYAIFSLPGLLVIAINIAGSFYDKAEVTTQVTRQIQLVMGGDTAKDIESIVMNATQAKATVLSSILGIATLLFGATGVFYQLQQMLNRIWHVDPKPTTRHRLVQLARDRLFSFGLILVVGFLLLVSLVLSAALAALGTWIASFLSASLNILFRILDILGSIGIITVLFAAIFKFLPDVKIRWRDVWGGAFLTSALFVVAKFALGFYFGKSDPGSTYGAAGSVILIMLWVSYAGLILLFGAEFTNVSIRSDRNAPKPDPTI